jgi:hypothetical protein
MFKHLISVITFPSRHQEAVTDSLHIGIIIQSDKCGIVVVHKGCNVGVVVLSEERGDLLCHRYGFICDPPTICSVEVYVGSNCKTSSGQDGHRA